MVVVKPTGAEADPGGILLARYTRTAASLHWIIAALMVGNIAAGLYCAYVDGAFRQGVMNAHKVIGLIVLGLSVARLGWRIAHRPPPLAFSSGLALWGAKGVHAALYVLMIALPLSGWLVTSSFPKRHPINAGLFEIPFLPVTPDKAVAFAAHEAHTIMAWAMIVLLVGHVGAALWHQHVLRDRLIDRMLFN